MFNEMPRARIEEETVNAGFELEASFIAVDHDEPTRCIMQARLKDGTEVQHEHANDEGTKQGHVFGTEGACRGTHRRSKLLIEVGGLPAGAMQPGGSLHPGTEGTTVVRSGAEGRSRALAARLTERATRPTAASG